MKCLTRFVGPALAVVALSPAAICPLVAMAAKGNITAGDSEGAGSGALPPCIGAHRRGRLATEGSQRFSESGVQLTDAKRF
jgi:hypothetical protein